MILFNNNTTLDSISISNRPLKMVFFFAIGGLLLGCKESPKAQQEDRQAVEVTEGTAVEAHHGGDTEASWLEAISLDQGAKWAANAETTSGVAQMTFLIANTKAESAGDYRNLGDGLNEIKNYIVKECTMTGASHDNLHVWLYPLIEKVGELQKVETVESGRTLTDDIKGHLDKYYEYFI